MSKTRIFIDGSAGTTGLRIRERLAAREDLELLALPEERRKDPAARAEALRTFVRGALSNPLLVGCHYFQYRDQPLVGRDDGEAYQIGFVDVCDRPYREVAEASREIGERLYSL